ncbi:MAG: hypothetical protein WC414_01530 [Patescibacteria group bacterium]
MSEEKRNLEKEIMEKIKSGKVSLRSKYIFLAEKLGFSSILIFSVILSILFLSLVLFYFKSTDNLIYLSFGSRGLFAFLESFPFLLVSCFIALIFLAGYLISKTEFAYKKSFGFITIIFVLNIFLFGALLAFTSMNHKLEYHFFNPNSDLGKKFKPFSQNIDNMRDHSIAGMILYVNYPEAIIQLPMFENEVIVNLSACKKKTLEKGDFVVFVGEKTGEYSFQAIDYRVVDDNELEMNRKRTERELENNCLNNNSIKCNFIKQGPGAVLETGGEDCFKACVLSDWQSKEECEKCMSQKMK